MTLILTYLACVMLGFALGYIACGLVRSMYVPPMLPCDDDEDPPSADWRAELDAMGDG